MRQHHLPSVWRDPAPQAQFCFECGAQVDAPSLQARPRQKVAFAQILERHGAQGFAERLLATWGQVRTGNTALYEFLRACNFVDACIVLGGKLY